MAQVQLVTYILNQLTPTQTKVMRNKSIQVETILGVVFHQEDIIHNLIYFYMLLFTST